MTRSEILPQLNALAQRFPHLDLSTHASGIRLTHRSWKGCQVYLVKNYEMHRHDLWASVRIALTSGWRGARICIAREVGEDEFDKYLEPSAPDYKAIGLPNLEKLLTAK